MTSDSRKRNTGTLENVKCVRLYSELLIFHFWSVLLKEQMMTSVRKTLKPWSDQHKTDRFLAKFALKITTKSAVFFTDCFPAKFASKIPAKFPRNRPIFLRFCP